MLGWSAEFVPALAHLWLTLLCHVLYSCLAFVLECEMHGCKGILGCSWHLGLCMVHCQHKRMHIAQQSYVYAVLRVPCSIMSCPVI